MDRNHASKSPDFPVLDDGPVIEIPPSFDQSFPRKLTKKVSISKNLSKICLALIKDKYALVELSTLIEEPRQVCDQRKMLIIFINE